jgi:hypothetical protein
MKKALRAETIQLIRGDAAFDPVEYHFGLGQWVRNELGLWKKGSRLRRACGTDCADEASAVLLTALWEDLVRTATPEEMAASREARRAYDEARAAEERALQDEIAAKDAAITDKRCPFCGKPCPTYRRTCKHCGREVRAREA